MNTTNITDNNLLSYVGTYYSRLMRDVDVHRKRLHGLLENGSYDEILSVASKSAGRKPGWNLEKGLQSRVKEIGYGNLIQPFEKLDPSDFEETLDAAEKLMKDVSVFNGSSRKLHMAALRVLRSCKFPEQKFSPTSIKYAAKYQLNKRSSSGFPDRVRKGRVLNKLIKEATSILHGLDLWHYPMLRGFKIFIKETAQIVSRKLRVIYPCPGSIILLELTYLIPFVSHFIKTKTFYMIGRNGSQLSKIIKEKFEHQGRLCSLDITAFDQYMPNEAIICAFWILRSQLKLTKQESIAFDKIVSYYCSSIMVSKAKGKPAYAFVKVHGIPSGSGFTNMIGTLSHAVVLEYLSPGILNNALVCGDDNLFSIKHASTSLNLLFEGYKSVFGLLVSPEKTSIFQDSTNLYFLGFQWLNYRRRISYRLAINQLLWHSDFDTTLSPFDREVARSASVLLNGYNGASLFFKLFPDIERMINSGLDVRFNYLQGYVPPTSSIDTLSSRPNDEPSINQSLRLHIEKGYLLR